MHYAAQSGKPEVLPLLCSRGGDVSAESETFSTPLHLAVQMNRGETVAKLLELGASVNAQDSTGLTPLHYAMLGGSVRIAEQLLTAGADLRVKDYQGRTAANVASLGNFNGQLDPVLRALGQSASVAPSIGVSSASTVSLASRIGPYLRTVAAGSCQRCPWVPPLMLYFWRISVCSHTSGGSCLNRPVSRCSGLVPPFG